MISGNDNLVCILQSYNPDIEAGQDLAGWKAVKYLERLLALNLSGDGILLSPSYVVTDNGT